MRIEAKTNGERVTVSVRDNGIGIPVDQRERVFKLFERLDPNYSGTGIGLAIVHRALERMQGTIELQSPTEGEGTIFLVTLPVTPTIQNQPSPSPTTKK